ncbi:MAG: hypothetical protein AAF830_00400 [Pseudomonadota bacterium]
MGNDGDKRPPNAKQAGLVAAGAAVVAAVSVTFMGKDPVPNISEPVNDTPPATIRTPNPDVVEVSLETQVCVDGLLATDTGCAALSDIQTVGQGLLSERALPSQPLRLVHPTDTGVEPKTVESCAMYAELKREGWGGMSSADMRREARFYRACGLLRLTENADPMPVAPALNRDVMQSLDRDTLPTFGEVRFDASDELTKEGERPAIWAVDGDSYICRMAYLATADFNADGSADHLMEWALAAKEGSFRETGFGLIEMRPSGRTTFSVIDPFAG